MKRKTAEMSMSQVEVYLRVDNERLYQEVTWGDKPQSVGAFITLLDFYVGEAKKSWAKNCTDFEAMHQIRKIAAIAVAAGEQHEIPYRDDIDFE